MSIILTLILGGFAGYIASIILNRNERMGIILNILVGIVGATVANFLVSPLVGIPAKLGEVSLSGFLMSVVGAVILLGIVNLLTRGRVR